MSTYFKDLNINEDIDTFIEIKELLKYEEGSNQKAVVFDIDQTSLLHRGKDRMGMQILFKPSKVNLFVKKIYDIAISIRGSNPENLGIYFVTARLDNELTKEHTYRELDRLGYTIYDGIFFRNSKNNNYQKYKTDVRKILEHDKGLTILLNV